jgi:hypothetical protein
MWIYYRIACIHEVFRYKKEVYSTAWRYHFRFVVVVRSMPPINSATLFRGRPMQSPLLHAPRADPKAVAIEEENLHAITALVGEQKQMAAMRVLLQLADDKRIESIE